MSAHIIYTYTPLGLHKLESSLKAEGERTGTALDTHRQVAALAEEKTRARQRSVVVQIHVYLWHLYRIRVQKAFLKWRFCSNHIGTRKLLRKSGFGLIMEQQKLVTRQHAASALEDQNNELSARYVYIYI